jgi:integrase
MSKKPPGSVYKRCGCRKGRAGLRLGTCCPRLAEEDHGSWFFSLDLPRHVGGRRRRFRRGGYATQIDAEQALARMRLPGGRVLTVADWLEIWLTTRVKIRATTCGHLEKVFTALVRLDGLTTATVRRVHSTLRSALNAAVLEKLTPDNPARYLELPQARRPHAVVWTRRRVRQCKRTGQRPPVAVWTPAQTAGFLNAIRGHRLYAAYWLIALRGLRRGEAAGLRWCDVDLDRRVMHVNWQLQYPDGALVVCPCLARRNMPPAPGVRRNRPTRFVISAGSALVREGLRADVPPWRSVIWLSYPSLRPVSSRSSCRWRRRRVASPISPLACSRVSSSRWAVSRPRRSPV